MKKIVCVFIILGITIRKKLNILEIKHHICQRNHLFCKCANGKLSWIAWRFAPEKYNFFHLIKYEKQMIAKFSNLFLFRIFVFVPNVINFVFKFNVNSVTFAVAPRMGSVDWNCAYDTLFPCRVMVAPRMGSVDWNVALGGIIAEANKVAPRMGSVDWNPARSIQNSSSTIVAPRMGSVDWNGIMFFAEVA